MRVKRLKKYKKYVNFFKVVYKFKPPFKIMLDGNFFHLAVQNSFNLRENFYKILADSPVFDIFSNLIISKFPCLNSLN